MTKKDKIKDEVHLRPTDAPAGHRCSLWGLSRSRRWTI